MRKRKKSCRVCGWIKEGTRIVHETVYHAILQADDTDYLFIVPKKHYDSLEKMPPFEFSLFNKEAEFWSAMLGSMGTSSLVGLGHAAISLEIPNVSGFSTPRKIFIVEGTNGCGKELLMDQWKRSLADATEISMHGFYLQLSRIAKTSDEVVRYCKDRLDCVVALIKSHCLDDFILSRFQISTQVYGEILSGARIDVRDCEEELNALGATLILLDVSSKSVLAERLRKRLIARRVPDYSVTPHLEESGVWNLRKMYLERFRESRIRNKIYFDTARQEPDRIREALCRQIRLSS